MPSEQDLWRAVHEEAAKAALTVAELDILRRWAGNRAKAMPGTVFAKCASTGVLLGLRPTFRVALAHAARDAVAGRLEADA